MPRTKPFVTYWIVFAFMLGSPLLFTATEGSPPSGWGVSENIDKGNLEEAMEPQVGIDSHGNAIAVWTQSDGTQWSVHSNVYVPGTGWTIPEPIEFQNIGDAISPQIAVNPSGNAIAVWKQHDGSYYSVYSNVYDRETGWGVSEPIENLDEGHINEAQVAIDPSGNGVAVWEYHQGTTRRIYANVYDTETGWGNSQIIEGAGSSSFYPQVSCDPSGNAIAVWHQYSGSAYRIVSNIYTPGSGWGTAEPIDSGDQDLSYRAEVGFDGFGNAIAVWQQNNGAGWNIHSNIYTKGEGWGTPQLIEDMDTGYAEFPKVGVDPSGDALVVWQQDTGPSYGIGANRYDKETGWGDAEYISPDITPSSSYPDIGVDSSGNGVAVWEQYYEDRTNIMANTYTAGIGWGAYEFIETNHDDNVDFPDLSVSTSGNAVAVWHQEYDTEENINANYYFRPDITPPTLTVDQPSDGSTVEVPTVTVQGTTEPGTTLSVNGILAGVRSDGYFSCNISLFEGMNTIVVTSTDDSGNSKVETRTIEYNDPILDIQEDILNLFNSVLSLGDQMDNVTERLDSMEANLTGGNEMESVKENLTDISSRLDSLRNNLTQFVSEMNTIGNDLDSLNDDMESLTEEFNEIQTELGSLETDLNNTESSLDSIQDTQDDMKSDVDSATEGLDSTRMIMIILIVVIVVLFVILLVMIVNTRRKPSRDDFE